MAGPWTNEGICGRCPIKQTTSSARLAGKHRFLGGALLLVLGFMMPLVITESTFGIYEGLKLTLLQQDMNMLIQVSLKTVTLNTIRSLPVYMGILFVMEYVNVYLKGKTTSALWGFLSSLAWYLTSFFLLLGFYTLIRWLYGLTYHIDLPALFILLVIRLLNRFPTKISSKILIIVLFFTCMQALDVAPGLTKWGFGQGEISLDIKNAALILGGEGVLRIISGMMFLAFGLSTGMMLILSMEQQQRMHIAEANFQMQKQLFLSREEAILNRNFREMQALVHDLKIPLTTISGLASLTLLMKLGPKIEEYQQRICDASEMLSEMISQMLYPDKRSRVTAQKLMETVTATFSTNPCAGMLSIENSCPDLLLSLNVTRVTRAIINLLENACRAVQADHGEILLRFERHEHFFQVLVRDNGLGISKDSMEKIWEPGYSKGRSSGFGLGFVRQIAHEHQGEVELESQEGSYTIARLQIPYHEEHMHEQV